MTQMVIKINGFLIKLKLYFINNLFKVIRFLIIKNLRWKVYSTSWKDLQQREL